jgi:ATP-dependent DNA helicase RecG
VGRSLQALAGLSVNELEAVSPKVAGLLAKSEVESVLDLLMLYPRRWIDRTREARIADLQPGEEGLVMASVRAVRLVPAVRGRGRGRVEVVVHDGTASMTVTFFNQPWRAKQLRAGMQITVFGKLNLFRGARQMVGPVIDLLGDSADLGAIVPVYPQSGDLTTSMIRRAVREALQRARDFEEPLPASVLDQVDVVDRTRAYHLIHEPDSMGAAFAPRKRLAFDELLRLQLILVLRKRAYERSARGIPHTVGAGGGRLVKAFLDSLPYELTGTQRRAVTALQRDLASPLPMHRLLQGDVGSGKTTVAVAALLTAVQGGWQGALMAPTEVLAEQHLLSIRPLLAGLTVDEEGSLFGARAVNLRLLTHKTTAKERAELLPALARGEVDILVGTHALLTEHVAFAHLGCVVVDEQHKFGVEQRAALRGKGGETDPDLLVMTATPIPRTAAMTVFGDLDVTVLDELPPGRTPIETVWAQTPMDVAMAWGAVRQAVGEGRQAFVVCPLVEESEKLQVTSAVAEHERLEAEELGGLRLGLLHGQMPSADKEAVMARFRAGEVDVLVATTVVEVGVDVPNATVMVIEDADRFGMAQLHQLRGRVGRGAHASRCYLLGGTDEAGQPLSDDVAERLGAMVRTTDGFELAEVDLELRGEGTILGTRQKGRSDLKLASLRRDKALVAEARKVAFALVGPDGHGLDRLPALKAEVEWLVDPTESDYLFKS